MQTGPRILIAGGSAESGRRVVQSIRSAGGRVLIGVPSSPVALPSALRADVDAVIQVREPDDPCHLLAWMQAFAQHDLEPSWICVGPTDLTLPEGTPPLIRLHPAHLDAIGAVACAAGEAARAVRSMRDTREALSLLEVRFRAVVEVGGGGYSIIGPTGTVLYQSPAATALLGHERGTLAGTQALDLLHPDDVPGTMALLADLLEAPGSTSTARVRVRTRGGTYRWVRATATNVLDVPGIDGILLHLRDCSLERALEEELARSHRARTIGEVTAGIVHDLNNLLSVILASTEVMRAKLGPDVAESMKDVAEAGERAARLTQQLLAPQRTHPHAFAVVELNPLVEGLTGLVRRILPPAIDLELSCAPRAGMFRGDAATIEHVLLNLIVNARDAMPEGGHLHVRTDVETTPRGSSCLIEVEDTGTGIAPENLEHIFDPFFTTKAPGHGTGLGLSTARELIAQHGGDLTVRTEKGRGSTFVVRLPRVETIAGLSAASTGRSAPSRESASGDVVIADADAIVRRTVRRVLEQYGMRVSEASTGSEAVARAIERGAQVLIASVDLPELDAAEAVRRIRAVDPLLAVVYTSGVPERLRDRARGRLDIDLPKPFRARDLWDAVCAVLLARERATP